MQRWMEQKAIRIKLYKRRQALGGLTTLTGEPIKPYNAQEAADKDRRVGLPLKFEGVRGFKRRRRSGFDGCILKGAALEEFNNRQAMRASFFASLKGI